MRASMPSAAAAEVNPMFRTALVFLSACLVAAPLLPTVGAGDTPNNLIELKGKAPDWFTPEVRAKAKAAAAEGLLLNPLTGETFTPRQAAAIVSIPVGAPDYLFIRPGALYLGENDALCTYNFIYDARTRIGVAGHCVDKVGDDAFILSVPAPTLPLLTVLGTVDRFEDAGPGKDWALINIRPAWQPWVDPAMAYVGGPSCPTWGGQLGVVKHAGHGIQTGLVASVPRVSQNGHSVGTHFLGIGEVSGGDSGSGVIQVYPASVGCALGAAAGIVTHCSTLTGLECLPIYTATDVRIVPAVVTTTLDPI